MKRIICGVAMLLLLSTAYSQGQLSDWAHSKTLDERVEMTTDSLVGVMVRESMPHVKTLKPIYENGKIVIKGKLNLKKDYPADLYSNLIYAIIRENEYGRESILKMSASNKRVLSTNLLYSEAYPGAGMHFTYNTAFEISGDTLNYYLFDVLQYTQHLTLIKKTLEDVIETLPAKSQRSATKIRELTVNFYNQLESYLSIMYKKQLPKVNNWDKIEEGVVELGMNWYEVILSKGFPKNISSFETKHYYSSSYEYDDVNIDIDGGKVSRIFEY